MLAYISLVKNLTIYYTYDVYPGKKYSSIAFHLKSTNNQKKYIVFNINIYIVSGKKIITTRTLKFL
jgi:hypothetical protein